LELLEGLSRLAILDTVASAHLAELCLVDGAVTLAGIERKGEKEEER
jgi:hypothetical protein